MGRKEGAAKAAAKRIGISVEEYLAHKNNSEKWCFKCTTWKPVKAFAKDRSRSDGYKAQCFDCVRVPPELNKPPSPPSFKGRTHSSDARRKMGEVQKGNKKRLGKPFTPEQLAYHKQHCFTPSGEAHWNWKGGITPENTKQRGLGQYDQWRKAVYARDNYTCVDCGDNRGGNLNAHHLHSWSEYPEHRLDVNNGIMLCVDCHAKRHKIPVTQLLQLRNRRQRKYER